MTGLTWLCLNSAILLADGPLDSITLPDGLVPFEIVPKDDPDARKAFQAMVQDGADAVASDPIMDEIMQVYSHRGSVLDGSLLDPKCDFWDETSPPPSGPLPHRQDVLQRLRAAELLLKTSRMIDKIKPLSENQRQLVIQMRQEAVKIMAASSVHPIQATAVSRTESTLKSCIKIK